jgi:hypothetical protein
MDNSLEIPIFKNTLESIYDYIGDLPLNGGWGYKKEDAVIINKYDLMVDQSYHFNGIGLEYFLIRHRNWTELITFKKEDEQFSEIEFNMLEQNLHFDEKHIYDHVVYEITCFRSSDYKILQEEWETKYGSTDFDINEHTRKRESKKVIFTKEIWFEISSFYGEEIYYNWDLKNGPFFQRNDGTKCPVEEAQSIADKITLDQRRTFFKANR